LLIAVTADFLPLMTLYRRVSHEKENHRPGYRRTIAANSSVQRYGGLPIRLKVFDISLRYQSPISLAVISATPSWAMT